MKIGAVELVPVLDAVGLLGSYAETHPDVDAGDWEPYRALYPELFAGNDWRLPFFCYLVRSERTTILVDTGVGPPGLWGWTAEDEGSLPGGLAAIGVRPDDIDVVFLTHLHIDHLGWNTDLDGVPFFPRARYLVHADALERAASEPDRKHIRRCVLPLLDTFVTMREDTELAPGVTAVDAPGHYPGHMALRIESDGRSAIVLGDVVAHPALLDRPEWVFAYDSDPATNEETRRALLPELVDQDVVVACCHYPDGGIGRVLRRDGVVTWQPAT